MVISCMSSLARDILIKEAVIGSESTESELAVGKDWHEKDSKMRERRRKKMKKKNIYVEDAFIEMTTALSFTTNDRDHNLFSCMRSMRSM